MIVLKDQSKEHRNDGDFEIMLAGFKSVSGPDIVSLNDDADLVEGMLPREDRAV